MKTVKKILATLLFSLLAVPFSQAGVGEKADFSSLDTATFYQGELSSSDLKGKVVFVECWGIRCGPCRATMPKLQALYDKYKDLGFVLIATHLQGATAEELSAYFEEKKLTFTSCGGFGVPQAPCPGGLPWSVLVGSNGRVVACGKPHEVIGKVEEEVRKAAGGLPILSGVKLNKHKKMRTTILEGAPNIESKITALRSREADEEAQAICEAYDAWLEKRKKDITTCRDQDALAFVAQANTLKKSVPSVTEFDEAVAALAENPDYVKLSDIRKKENALRKKSDEGKKIFPKSIEALVETVGTVASDDAGIAGGAKNLKTSLTDFSSQVKTSLAAEQAKKEADKEDKKAKKKPKKTKRSCNND